MPIAAGLLTLANCKQIDVDKGQQKPTDSCGKLRHPHAAQTGGNPDTVPEIASTVCIPPTSCFLRYQNGSETSIAYSSPAFQQHFALLLTGKETVKLFGKYHNVTSCTASGSS